MRIAMLELDRTKLKKLREERNLTQGELGQKVGKTTSDISNYENGVASPKTDTLLSLMDFFGVSPREIAKESSTCLG
jgi:transcriptional regulator with XRE-family HTH domain